MVTSIIENGQITCTLARAKEVRKPLEKMIGLGKRGTLHSRRQALRFVKSKEAMAQLFGDLAKRYKDRHGGYCRIIKLGKNRLGDNSEMAIIQLLGSEGDKLSELKTQKGAKKKQKKKESTVLKEVSEEIQQIPETEEKPAKGLKKDNVTQESGKEVSVEAENKAESDEEELIQEENPHETKAKDTAEVENKVKADEEDGDSTKDTLKEEDQAEAPQVKNEAEAEKTEPEKPEAKKDDTAEVENKVKADEEDGDSTKDTLKEENQAEAPQVKNEAEAKSTQEKNDADSNPESTDESEEVNKTKS
jgi:large subunit ribosomal protein L17